MTETFQDRSVVPVSHSGQTGGELREAIIVPWGLVKSLKGEFLCDEEAAAAMVEAFDAHAVAVPIDWEHSTLSATRKAPAAGWIERLYAAPGVAVKGLVRWTEAARDALRADRYRYLSPVVVIRRDDGRAVELHSAALTNKPAIRGAERVAASTRDIQNVELAVMAQDESVQEAQALGARLRKLLGLGDDAPIAEVLRLAIEKIEKFVDSEEQGGEEDKAVANAAREILGLPTDAGKSAFILAMRTRETGESASELASMKAAETVRVAQGKVDAYIQANKLNPNDKAAMSAALDLAQKQPETLDLIMRNVAPYVQPGRTTPPPGPGSRAFLISSSAKEHASDSALRKSCSGRAYVNMTLKEHGFAPLTSGEETEFIVAAV